MTTDLKDKAEVEKRLWSEIEHARFGMLGPVGCEVVQHFQPMTAFAEPESGKIWFFTNSETDLARAAEPGVAAMFVVASRDGDVQALRLAHPGTIAENGSDRDRPAEFARVPHACDENSALDSRHRSGRRR